MSGFWQGNRTFCVVALCSACLIGCGKDESPEGSSAVWACRTTWGGEIPPEATRVTARGCLNDSICSPEVSADLSPTCVADGDTVVRCAGNAYAWGSEVSLEADWGSDGGVRVDLEYFLEVSDRLSVNDRTSLRILAEGGTILVDSISAVPYRSVQTEQGVCRVAAVDFTGAPLEW